MTRLFPAAAVLLVLGLCGCGELADTFDAILPSAPKPPLPGKRVSVLNLEQDIKPDPSMESVEVRLPQPVVNRDWPEAGGYPSHAMYHLALGDRVRQAWSRSFGEGNSRDGQILASPVIENGRIFTMDSESLITGFDTRNGRRLWKFDPQPKRTDTTTFGGGIAALGNRVYVSTGYAEVLALDAKTGRPLWRRSVPGPVHASPTVADGRVFAVTVDNELVVLSADDGRVLWTHNGLPETAGLLGGSSPAVEGDIVVVAYSSGEIFALQVQNGRQLWTDNLASARSLDALTTLADIRGRPVIDHGLVFAISHSGRMVAIDLRTGDRVWEQDLGGSFTPWVAGDYVYVLTNEDAVVCLTRHEGKIKWALDLPRYENEEKKKGPLDWSGPVLASDRLIVLASNGDALSISPYTGKALGRISFSDGSYVSPVLANRTLYIVTQGADLIAYR